MVEKHLPVSALFCAASLLLGGLALAADGHPERGDDAKRNSKNGKLEGTLGGAKFVLTYGRPQAKGRSVFGGLVEYGKVWRTGADEATAVTFESPVTVQGKKLPAGTYALFTIPGPKKWTVIFNRQAKQWGAYKYDPKQDALRVEVMPKSGSKTEALTFTSKDDTLSLHWDETVVPIRIAKGG